MHDLAISVHPVHSWRKRHVSTYIATPFCMDQGSEHFPPAPIYLYPAVEIRPKRLRHTGAPVASFLGESSAENDKLGAEKKARWTKKDGASGPALRVFGEDAGRKQTDSQHGNCCMVPPVFCVAELAM